MKVNVVKRVKVDGKDWRFVPVVMTGTTGLPSKEGVRYKRDGEDGEWRAGGDFFLDYREGGKRKRVNVGSDPGRAKDAKKQLEAKLSALATGLVVSGTKETLPARSLEAVSEAWLKEIEEQKDSKTWVAYKSAAQGWLASCGKPSIDQVDRQDLLALKTYLSKQGLKPRTVRNKFTAVVGMLKWAGISVKKLGLTSFDVPKYVKTVVKANSMAEINAMMQACQTPQETLLFTFLLATGFRLGEAKHVTWRDVDFENGTVTVSHKPAYNWTPKSAKERTIQLADSVLARLVEAKKTSTNPLIFPSKTGKPDGRMRIKIQDIAVRAGLDRKAVSVQQMRRNMATMAYRGSKEGNLNIADLMAVMGHSSLEPTSRYVQAATGPETRPKLNSIFL
jgi:integrase